MKSTALILIALLTLAGCSGGDKSSRFICANGPDLTAIYSGDSVTLNFTNGTSETLARPDPARQNLYSNGRISWSVGGRDARLDMDGRSLLCDSLG
jgi:hypothetical protein